MARQTANEIVQMFADRKSIEFGPTTGSAWAQRNGTEGASFWVSQKQADWVLGVFARENRIDRNIREAEGTIYIDGKETAWKLNQTSKKSNNGAGAVQLAR